jgi:hydrogenase 3 maturation protease
VARIYDFLSDRLQGAERLAILGVGSVLRADDAAGTLIAEKMAEFCPAEEYTNLRGYAGETAPENFSGKILSFCPTHLLIVDAADLGLSPGEFAAIDPDEVGGPTFCSHMLPLKIMIDYLVRETGTQVTLLGMQYQDISFDQPMTPEAEGAVGTFVEALRSVISELFGSGGPN